MRLLREDMPALTVWQQGLPNLMTHCFDALHCARRFTSRLWKADPYLQEVQATLVTGSRSICQILRFSDLLREGYTRFAHRMQHCEIPESRLSGDMGAAKHRCESAQRPLGRAILMLEALIAQATAILRERAPKTKEHEAAAIFLEWLDEESILQSGMVADAGDEHMILVRVLEPENVDPAELTTFLSSFLARVHALFVRGGCWESGL